MDGEASLVNDRDRIGDREAWLSTILFGLLGLAAAVPLVLLSDPEAVPIDWPAATLAGAIFWGCFGVPMIFVFWDLYYSKFYPAWMRRMTPLAIVLYAGLSLGMWWLAGKLPGHPVMWFVVLGGLEGVAEHVIGIYVLKILEKVPFLNGLAPIPAIVFSFFEYILYWSIAGWIAYGLTQWWN